MTREITSTNDLTRSALRLFADEIERSVDARGRFVVALSGGSTPLGLYRALAERPELPWGQTLVFWGDERFVPHEHPDSTYRATREALLNALPIPAGNIHPWPAPDERVGLEQAAEHYAGTLQEVLGDPPIFDLQLLGLGDDGHTASLFPGTSAVHAQGLTVASRPKSVKQPRLSLTASALSHSRAVVFLVSGENKREALRATLQGSNDEDRYPARAVSALERLVWLTDLPVTF